MTVPDESIAYLRWYEEDAPEGASGPRRVMAAWLVRDILDDLGERQELLAYLGRRPAVTAMLQEEVVALYPDVRFDWEEIRRALSGDPASTSVRALTDDELAFALRDLVRERGMSLMDLSLRLGYRDRQILPEVVRLLENAQNVARIERTSGTLFEYLLDKHLDYAFLLYKARLFFEGDERTLDETIEAEPAGMDDDAWRSRRTFWRSHLESYRQRRQTPEPPE